MRIAICEDSAADSTLLLGHLKEFSATRGGGHTFVAFSSGDKLLSALNEGQEFDCYLLDILMGALSGIDVARELRCRGDKRQIIFLTSSPDYALSAFSVRAHNYLLKPVQRDALFSALDEVAEETARQRRRALRHFTFRTPSGLQTTAVSDLLYVEIVGHTPTFHLVSGPIRGSAMRVPFEESVAPLLACVNFLRPHRSFLVNATYVAALTPKNLRLNNGVLIPVARTRAADVRARYLDYLAEADGHG